MDLIDVLVPVGAGANPGELDRRLFALWGQDHRPLAVHVCGAGPGEDGLEDVIALHDSGKDGFGCRIVEPDAGAPVVASLERALTGAGARYVMVVPENTLLYPEACGLLLETLRARGSPLAGAPLRALAAERHLGFDYPLGVLDAPAEGRPMLVLADRQRATPGDLAAVLAGSVSSSSDRVAAVGVVAGDILTFAPEAAGGISRAAFRHWP